MTAQWQDEAAAFGSRSLAGSDYVYVWVDGIHLKVRLEADKVCLLVMIGVRADGRKELIALADGFRESSESWADLLRDCRRSRDCLESHATVVIRLRSNSTGVSHPSWLCRRWRFCQISRYSKIALASSRRVFHVLRSNSSTCMRDQNDSIMELS